MLPHALDFSVHVYDKGLKTARPRPVFYVGPEAEQTIVLVQNDHGYLYTALAVACRPCVANCPVEGCPQGAVTRMAPAEAAGRPPTPVPRPASQPDPAKADPGGAIRGRVLGEQARDAQPKRQQAAAGAPTPATEPQIKALYAIGRGAREWDDAALETWCRTRYGVLPADLTKRQASEAIDALKANA